MNFNPPAMPYGPATGTIETNTGNNRGAAALSWFQAIGGLGTNVLSVLTGNPSQQNTTINTPAPGAPGATAGNDYTMWIVGGIVLAVVAGIAYMIFRKK